VNLKTRKKSGNSGRAALYAGHGDQVRDGKGQIPFRNSPVKKGELPEKRKPQGKKREA